MVSWNMLKAVLLTFTLVMLYYAGLYIALKLFIVSTVCLVRLFRPRRPSRPA